MNIIVNLTNDSAILLTAIKLIVLLKIKYIEKEEYIHRVQHGEDGSLFMEILE